METVTEGSYALAIWGIGKDFTEEVTWELTLERGVWMDLGVGRPFQADKTAHATAQTGERIWGIGNGT